MLINTKIIKEAFGISETDKFTVETTSVLEGLQSLLGLLNQDINFWDFEITTDTEIESLAKIVDTQITRFDFKKPIAEQTTEFDDAGVIVRNGVYFFPVWKTNSIVKSQNISARIPDSMALATMYGGNMDQMSEFSNPGNVFADKEGIAVSGLWNEYADGSNLQGLGLAFRVAPNIGSKSNGEPITINGGKENGILEYMNDPNIQKKIRKAYKDKLEEVNNALKVSPAVNAFNDKFPQYDPSVPPPLPRQLSESDVKQLLQFENEVRWYEGTPISDLINSKFLDNGEMKPPFKNSVIYQTTEHGETKKANTPLLIPLELELEIDGIGGVYPGNSYHSDFVPKEYQKKTVFQMFDVGHRVDSSGWTTSITGKMRMTLNRVFDRIKSIPELNAEQFTQLLNKAKLDQKKRDEEKKKFQEENPVVSNHSGRTRNENVRAYQKTRAEEQKKARPYIEQRAKASEQARDYQQNRGGGTGLGTNRSGRANPRGD